MVVIDKYYEFVDKPTNEITRSWKVCHIFLYAVAATAGILAHYMLSLIRTQFQDNCILSPNITFTVQNLSELNDNTINNSSKIVIDLTKTAWGDDTLCSYCEYAPVMSMILGCILLTFFIMCPRGGSRASQSGIRRPWHIVLPTIFFTTVFLIFIITTSILTYKGVTVLCTEFLKNSSYKGCHHSKDYYIQIDEQFGENTLPYIHSLSTFLGVMVVSWALALVLLCCRCCTVVDFKLLEVTVSVPEEEIDGSLEETEVLLEQNPTSSPGPENMEETELLEQNSSISTPRHSKMISKREIAFKYLSKFL